MLLKVKSISIGVVTVGIISTDDDLSKSNILPMFSTSEEIVTPSEMTVQEAPVTEGASAAMKALKSTAEEASTK